MEVAVAAPPEAHQRLIEGGWSIGDPRAATWDAQTYQRYIQRSRAEFSVAKHAYVSTRCGWFSERSTSYMASGRPAVIQDTGFSDFLPCGAGLLPFRTPAEARLQLRRLREDYVAHCRAARALVEECFDARQVLTDLLERSL